MAMWVALPVLVLLGLLLLGGFVAMVMMLAHPKTRAAGIVLLLMGLVVVFIGGALFLARFSTHQSARVRVRQQEAQDVYTEMSRLRVRQQETQRAYPEILPSPNDNPAPVTASDAAVDAQPKTAAAPVSMLRALGRVLGKGLSEQKKQQQLAAAATNDANEVPSETADENGNKSDDEIATKAAAPGDPKQSSAPPESEVARAPTPRQPSDLAPADRPAWVNAGPGKVDGAYQMVARVGPYQTPWECDANEASVVQQTLAEYVEVCLAPASHSSAAAARMRMTPEIRRQVVVESWDETDDFQVTGPMIQRFVLLRFDRHARDLIQAEYNRAVVVGRLWYVGAGLAVVLALLSVLFATLKIDLATQGTYRGRLCLAAVAVMAPVVVVAYLVLASVQGAPVMPPAASPTTAPTALASHTAAHLEVVPFSALPRVLLILTAIGGTLGLLLLLGSRKTRPAGVVVLVLAIAGVVFFWYFSAMV